MYIQMITLAVFIHLSSIVKEAILLIKSLSKTILESTNTEQWD